jgi:hypothetical protein
VRHPPKGANPAHLEQKSDIFGRIFYRIPNHHVRSSRPAHPSSWLAVVSVRRTIRTDGSQGIDRSTETDKAEGAAEGRSGTGSASGRRSRARGLVPVCRLLQQVVEGAVVRLLMRFYERRKGEEMATPSQRRRRTRWGLVAVMLFAVLAFGAVMASADSGATPTISSDQADYWPGSTVTLTGSGFQGDTTVTLAVNDSVGAAWSWSDSVAPDATGSFTDTLTLPSTVIATYSVNAVGSPSAAIATTSFTDTSPAQVRLAISGLPTATVVSVPIDYYNNGGRHQTGTSISVTSGTTSGPTSVDPASAFGFTFPTTVSPTGQTCTYQSADHTNPFTTGASGSDTRVTGTYSCVATPPADVAPSISWTADPSTVTVGDTNTYTFSITDSDSSSWSFASTSYPDCGSGTVVSLSASINDGARTGTFLCSFGAAGSTSVSVEVSDGTKTSNVLTQDVLVSPPPDTTPPVITPNISGTLGNNGWYTSNVTVTWTVTDDESSISSESGCGSTTISTDTTATGTTLTCMATSAGGTNSQSVTIKRDASAPTVTATATYPDSTPYAGAWTNEDITVHFVCSDALSLLADSCPADTVVNTSSDTTAGTVVTSGTIHDNAGNSSSASVTIYEDKTAPTITFHDRTPANGNGWNKTDVTVNWTCADALSGPVSASVSQTVSTEGANQSATGTCTDNAGNSKSDTQTGINIDEHAPTVAYTSATPAPNGYGWNNTDVIATFTATDTLSGFAGPSTTQTGTSTTSGEGSAVTVGSPPFTDQAGNTAAAGAATSDAFMIDKTKPTVAVTGFNNGDVFTKGVDTLPTVGCSRSDDRSGLDPSGSTGPTVTAGGLDANGVGSVTYMCGAKDYAGNYKTASATYSVIYGGLSGILQPINPNNTSVFSRGKAIPVKFQLAGDQPTGFITTSWTIQQQSVACNAFDTTDETLEETTSNTPSTLFRYDASADQYIYNADMHTLTVGTCWKFKVTLVDSGQTFYSAVFKLQK